MQRGSLDVLCTENDLDLLSHLPLCALDNHRVIVFFCVWTDQKRREKR